MNYKKLLISNRLLNTQAEKLGITCKLFNNNHLVQMSYKGKSWYFVGTRTSNQSAAGLSIANQKPIAKELLIANDIPTARYAVANKKALAKNLFDSFNFPVVVKPVDGQQGTNVHIGVKSSNEIHKIVNTTADTMMVEETLQGTEYRIFCVDYKFVAAAYKKPAFVIGDGEKTIKELIETKNKDPLRGTQHSSPLSKIKINKDLIKNVTEQLYNLNSIPKKGVEIFLRKTSNISTGGEAENVTNTVCKENIEMFERIAKICDLNIIGIDFMCKDLSTPVTNQKNIGVIEVNASPGLRMHHYPSIGEPINVAKLILEMILKDYKL